MFPSSLILWEDTKLNSSHCNSHGHQEADKPQGVILVNHLDISGGGITGVEHLIRDNKILALNNRVGFSGLRRKFRLRVVDVAQQLTLYSSRRAVGSSAETKHSTNETSSDTSRNFDIICKKTTAI